MEDHGYFDIDVILSGEERIQCTFNTDAIDCGFLDPSCVGDDIMSGDNVELPLWLVNPLCLRGDITPTVPNYLSHRFRRLIKSGPSSINLREFSLYFYDVAKQILSLVENDEQMEIENILRLAFGGERYRAILNNSMNSLDEDTTEFTRKLTVDEKKLFMAGAYDSNDFLQWKGRQIDTIAKATVVERVLKRRKVNS